MPQRKISHLRYLALAMPNMQEESDFFTKYWGLTEMHREGDVVWLGTEGSPEPYQIRLRQGE